MTSSRRVNKMHKAQAAAAQNALDFIIEVGFETSDNKVTKPKCTEIEFEETLVDGTVSKKRVEVPILNLIPLPIVNIKDVGSNMDTIQSITEREY